MSRRMTLIFEDESLYTALKVEAARTGRHAKDIVAEAVGEWLQAAEDEELRGDLEEARQEWQREGGVEAGQFFRPPGGEQGGRVPGAASDVAEPGESLGDPTARPAR